MQNRSYIVQHIARAGYDLIANLRESISDITYDETLTDKEKITLIHRLLSWQEAELALFAEETKESKNWDDLEYKDPDWRSE